MLIHFFRREHRSYMLRAMPPPRRTTSGHQGTSCHSLCFSQQISDSVWLGTLGSWSPVATGDSRTGMVISVVPGCPSQVMDFAYQVESQAVPWYGQSKKMWYQLSWPTTSDTGMTLTSWVALSFATGSYFRPFTALGFLTVISACPLCWQIQIHHISFAWIGPLSKTNHFVNQSLWRASWHAFGILYLADCQRLQR